MSWNWVDKTEDKSGLQWRYRETGNHFYVYIPGTDHVDDIHHHTQIGLIEAANGIWVTKADLLLAKDIVRTIQNTDKPVRIGGHSWGGGVAALIVWIGLQRGWTIHGWLYGPKQEGNRAFIQAVSKCITAYRHRGDWIPMLIPWLASYYLNTIGHWTWPWKAHGPSTYHPWMEAEGFR